MVEATFRTDFPEFTSTTMFTSATITFWAGIAEKLLIASRWLDLYDQGVELFVAHHLALAAKDQAAGALGGIGGGSTGVVSSKTADVSISYDTNAGLETGAGHWNLTTYGRMFIRLARLCGTGGVQL